MVGIGVNHNNYYSAFSAAYDVSADGSVVVGRQVDASGVHMASIWTEETGMVFLWDLLTDLGVDLSDWIYLDSAYGISNDGNIVVGTGLNKAGESSAFRIDLRGSQVPVPGAFTLLTAGLLGLVGLRRTRN